MPNGGSCPSHPELRPQPCETGEVKLLRIQILILTLSSQVAATVDDIEERHGFNYESFFDQQIQKKKMDHSYRVFKKVSRDAANFPAAREFSWGKKEITVKQN